jgi:ATP-dependent DNA helicase RecG
MSDILDSEIKFLPGVGPKRAEVLGKEAEIFTFRDLISYYPFKYVDKTRFTPSASSTPPCSMCS